MHEENAHPKMHIHENPNHEPLLNFKIFAVWVNNCVRKKLLLKNLNIDGDKKIKNQGLRAFHVWFIHDTSL